jgi:hypothetical protein
MQHLRGSRRLFLLFSVVVVVLVLGGAVHAQSTNIALGADPTRVRLGWGGGIYPWDMVDGRTSYDEWYHGLAFTGGILGWGNEACGWRQATLNFGRMETFNRVMIWHHGTDHIPNTFNLMYWDGSEWRPTGGTYAIRYDLTSPPSELAGSTPTEHIFPTVMGSKVRFALYNCDITHGWIYEFQVFHDNQAPVCSAARPSADSLWPPQHQMVGVNILGVTDPEGDPVTVMITGIYQDEPVLSVGDGNTRPDASGIGADQALLRAERTGTGNGRVYHINFAASDGWGGTCAGVVRVRVDKSQGRNGIAVDDGPQYDSTAQ